MSAVDNQRRWRQPTLGDGTPVPLTADGDNDETKLELSLSCRDLLSSQVEDVKCFCVVYLANPAPALKSKRSDGGEIGQDAGDGSVLCGDPPVDCSELGRTEVVYNSANPDFATVFVANFSTHMDKPHDVVVMVYSEQDIMDDDLNKQQFLGRATFCLERILSSASRCASLPLESGGCITMTVQLLDLDCEFLMFCYAGKDFRKRSKTPVMKAKKRVPENPYIVVSYKNAEDSKWRILWKSEAVQGSESSNFGYGHFQLNRVNGGDEETPIQILAMDWDEKKQRYKTIGQAETTLKNMSTSVEFDLLLKGKRVGRLVSEYVDKVNIPTMAHYVVGGGCSLDVTFAVDLTSNNGGPGKPDSEGSLHHLNENGELNAYETVLHNISTMFQNYSAAPKFQLWGYGAISEGPVDHRFAMGEDGCCDGVQGLMSLYSETMRSGITMSGPKLLRPTLDAAIERAIRNSQSKLSYSVLIVLCCDGVINDTAEVMEKISQASYVPLSVIFVGVGNGNFRDLNEMKFENSGLVSPSGNVYMRDVALFVQMSKFEYNIEDCMHKIVEKIPTQLVQYHLSQGIFPPESHEKKDEEGECLASSSKATGESSMETVVTNNRTKIDYGKYLLDSMAALDSDEEEEDPQPSGKDSDEFHRSVDMNF